MIKSWTIITIVRESIALISHKTNVDERSFISEHKLKLLHL